MLHKKSFYCLLMLSFLLSNHNTQSFDSEQNTPTHLAVIASGIILSGGGTYWLVKNPKKEEGIIGRSCRTAFALSTMALGLSLILKNQYIVEQTKEKGIIKFLLTLFSSVNTAIKGEK